MGYFHDVYLKRLNIDGETRQERIKTRKEKEFDLLFLKQSQYQAKIFQYNQKEDDTICSLQPNKWNETQLISNLLVSTTNAKYKTGDILYIYQKIKEIEYNKLWLVLFCEDNISKGYRSYKVICLDEEINITNEYGDTLYTVPVKVVNATATFVEDLFQYKKKGYREGNMDRKIITRNFDFLKKDTYFKYKDRGWEITGKDDISIKNVAYVSISERLIDEPEPRTSEEIKVGAEENFFLNNR